jgi:glycosyltransferase involved in cell wall biosynthesis
MSRRVLCLADVRFPVERANGIQTIETCAAMARRGHAVRLVVRPDTTVPARDPFEYYGVERDAGLSIERVRVAGPAPFRRIGFLVGALARALATRRDDVVLTRDLGVASLYLRARRSDSASLVYESHGFAPAVSRERPAMLTGAAPPSWLKQRRLWRREARVWRQADGYATITRGLADELVERFGPRPALAVVPDGARVDAGRRFEGRAIATPAVVGYSGHLYPWKGVDLLLDALAELAGVNGIVVGGHPGENDLARLRNRAGELGLGSRVTFTGMVGPRDVTARLEPADVLVLPNPATAASERYTSPLKLFEYLAMGRPIVASDLPAFREVVRHGDNALLFEPGSARALAAAVRTVVGSPQLAASIARRAFETARDYSWDARAERLDQLFGEAAGRRAGWDKRG